MEYPKIKVVVRCFTFNQSKYIKETMNGFTMQQTEFPFVCCIVDDSSTDGEQEVIKDYLKDNFNLSDTAVAYQKDTDYAHVLYAQHKMNQNCFFAVLLLKENHYSKDKSKLGYLKEWTEGVPYVALCEGDDFWIAPNKLQMQVDFLDNNIEFGLTYTQACVCNKNNEIDDSHIIGTAGCNSFNEMIEYNPIPTLTTVFRNSIYSKYLNSIDINPQWKMGDYPIWLFFSLKSKIHFFEKVTSAYRYLPESASHSRSLKKRLLFIKGLYLVRKDLIYYANRKELLKRYRRKYWSEVLVLCMYQIAVFLKVKS